MSDNGKIGRQGKNGPKVRWNGWLTTENYDFVARQAIEEECSMARILNRILRRLRQEQSVPHGTS